MVAVASKLRLMVANDLGEPDYLSGVALTDHFNEESKFGKPSDLH